ncbi:MAG: histidinol dehydrogenase [Limisphaerales bacterium]|jgi:histidinol dehydrogenase|nr:histidinol dehydrogenase [Verrucomicrobiota bacterium]
MKVLKYNDPNFDAEFSAVLATSSLFDAVIEKRVHKIVDEVRLHGDQALVDFTARFDKVQLDVSRLKVTVEEEVAAALKTVIQPGVDRALKEALKNITSFAKKSLRKNWQSKNSHGAMVGEKFDPFYRVGIYVPAGKAPLASSALMSVTLAKVAGCKEIVVCTPCGKDGALQPELLYAAMLAGATEIYRVGGAQAIAAMAFGTQTIGKVQKVFGPGNAYVVAAKRMLFGHVSMDLLPGPSEVLVIADSTANPSFIAADILAQAEHGSGKERVWLVSTSAKVLEVVEKEIARQLESAERKELLSEVLEKGTALILAKNMQHAVELANRLAPEHCEVMTKEPRNVAEGIHTAGALMLGNYSPAVLGDYVAGPSHVLPTGGAGASFAGLTVDQFQRRTSLVEYSKENLEKAMPAVRKFAAMEGLIAHGRSAELRLED